MAQLIRRIRVESLFGLYTYTLPEDDALPNAAILYGDNGVGKSTILRLVFHLLSAAGNRGHRGALYAGDFARIEVDLSTGIQLTAQMQNRQPAKILTLEVREEAKPLAIWDYRPSAEPRLGEDEDLILAVDERGEHILRRRSSSRTKKDPDGVLRGEQPYLEALKRHVPTLFMLNADRRLDSDSVSDPSDEVELRRMMQYGEPRRINELVARSREIALSQALSAAARWISRRAVIDTNQGSINVHSVYGDVLRRLMSANSRQTTLANEESAGELDKQLIDIDAKSAQHARYELATHLPTNDFRKALSGKTKKSQLAVELLKPYIKSVEGRLEAVEPLYRLIDRFMSVINSMLKDKSLTFRLSHGFEIHNRLGVPLAPAQLSSGEQQLLLLFCYVLTARDAPTIFMIDEPEISLNVKWQRGLVQSLLDITEGASIQFVFASHSMELLAQHRSRVVKLVNRA